MGAFPNGEGGCPGGYDPAGSTTSSVPSLLAWPVGGRGGDDSLAPGRPAAALVEAPASVLCRRRLPSASGQVQGVSHRPTTEQPSRGFHPPSGNDVGMKGTVSPAAAAFLALKSARYLEYST